MSAYNCRAVLLLQKELVKIQKAHLWGVDVEVGDEDVFKWKVTLSGLKDTSWQGSRLEVSLTFNEEYNHRPPHVVFTTIPVHPNVDIEDGSVCLDCLSEWRQQYSVMSIIVSLQQMLSEPSLTTPLNPNAARLAQTSPNHYKQIVLDTVLRSQQHQTRRSASQECTPLTGSPILPVHSPQSTADETIPRVESTEALPSNNNNNYNNNNNNRHKLSYEHYLTQWKSIGTTQPPVSNRINSPPSLGEKQTGSPRTSASQVGGKLPSLPSHLRSEDKVHRLKATRMQLLKDIRGNKKGGRDLSISLLVSPPDTAMDGDVDEYLDIDNTEANSLVSWSETLPPTE